MERSSTINGNAIKFADPERSNDKISQWILVQSKTDRLSYEAKVELKSADVDIQEYLGGGAYLCRNQLRDTNSLDALKERYKSFIFIGDVIFYYPDLKITPSLKASLSSENEQTPTSNQHLAPITVAVVLHSGPQAGLDMARASVENITKTTSVNIGDGTFKVDIQPEHLYLIAGIDNVRSIEPPSVFMRTSDLSRKILKIDNDALPPIHAKYTGGGEIIAILDSGLDGGDAAIKNGTMHPAFRNRVVGFGYRSALGRDDTTTPDGKDTGGHGTHVAGCAAGGPYDKLPMVKGAAPCASIFPVVFTWETEGFLYEGFFDFIDPTPQENQKKVNIINNSWESAQTTAERGVQKAYKQTEAGVVDHDTNENKELLVCFGAGNSGDFENKQHDPSGGLDSQITGVLGAKNCLTVGATCTDRQWVNEVGSYDPNGKLLPGKDDTRLKKDNIPPFSSRGPTLEGRIKPDVVAPGTAILSAHSSLVELKNPEPYKGNTSMDYYPYRYPPLEGEARYSYSSGTSMAAPLVSGCAALLREALRQEYTVQTPTSALLKALFVNGAEDLAGKQFYITREESGKKTIHPYTLGKAPNPIQGFGRVDVRASLDHITLGAFEDRITIAPGPGEQLSRHSHTFEPHAKNDLEFSVTLVWTDPPAAKLQHYIELTVRELGEGREYIPNQGSESNDDISNPGKRFELTPYASLQNNVLRVRCTIPKGDNTKVKVIVECLESKDNITISYSLAWSFKDGDNYVKIPKLPND
ncbi:peptidase S8/S53 domain-containing protein [Nemania sp. FL0031]|nr:peptidase S8/S53 domain-containing protein [Nemania sp. FL0031]